MPSLDPNLSEATAKESAARASFLRLTPLKWRVIRICEVVMKFLKPLLPLPAAVEPLSKKPASILVIEYWNLGDLAILVPFLRNLRRSFPLARISLLVDARFKSLLEGQGIVDEFIPVSVPWAQHFSRIKKYNPFSRHWVSLARCVLALRKRRFDWAFSGRMDFRDNLLLWLVGARRRIGYGIGGGGSFLTDRVMPDLAHPHRADVWLRLLETVGAAPQGGLNGARLQKTDIGLAESYLAGLGIPPDAFLVGIHPDARSATRCWGDERFTEVARRLVGKRDVHVLWFSEPGQVRQAPRWKGCHSVTLNLGSFVTVLSLCRLLVCNDSGPMHLANLLNVPVVAVFGPQRPEWFGPRGPRDRVVIHPEFWCRPCSDYCIFDQPYCLRTISVDEVYSAVEGALGYLYAEEPREVQAC